RDGGVAFGEGADGLGMHRPAQLRRTRPMREEHRDDSPFLTHAVGVRRGARLPFPRSVGSGFKSLRARQIPGLRTAQPVETEVPSAMSTTFIAVARWSAVSKASATSGNLYRWLIRGNRVMAREAASRIASR